MKSSAALQKSRLSGSCGFFFIGIFSSLLSLLLTGEHSRLLSEPDPGVEVSVTDAGGQVDRTLL